MSALFDRLLCDPDEASLSNLGWEAFEHSGFPLRARQWTPTLRALAASAEGRALLRPPPHSRARQCYVAVAWWSDHQGRKHVRVTAGNVAWPEARRHYSRLDEDERPPWWHICPERVYRGKRGDAGPAWLACCACGEVGTARQLAWMGDCCGPCHDRREEGAALQIAEPPSIVRTPGPICGLTFDGAGDRLAVSSGGRVVYVYDLRTGAARLLHGGEDDEEHDEIRALAFSPDGEWLAGADQGYARIHVWGAGRADLRITLGARVTGLAFSPDGRFLAGRTDAGDLRLWDPARWRRLPRQRREVTAFDIAPDGQVLAAGSHGGVICLLEAGSLALRNAVVAPASDEEDVLFLKYTPDGARLVLVTGHDAPGLGGGSWQLRVWGLAEKRELRSAPIPAASVVELTPDGRYLAWLVHDDQHSPAAVHFWDLESWQPAGWLEWDPEDDLRDLAFSPDGRTLATGSASGVVKLWPWSSLLA